MIETIRTGDRVVVEMQDGQRTVGVVTDRGPDWITLQAGDVDPTVSAFASLSNGGEDQSSWPAHLRDDAPQARCSGCRRYTVAVSEFGQTCGMPQPDGSRCAGRFDDPRASR